MAVGAFFFQSKIGIYVVGTSSRTVKRGNKCVSEMSHSAVELFHTGLFTHAYVCVCMGMGVGGHKHPVNREPTQPLKLSRVE